MSETKSPDLQVAAGHRKISEDVFPWRHDAESFACLSLLGMVCRASLQSQNNVSDITLWIRKMHHLNYKFHLIPTYSVLIANHPQ